MKQKYSLLILSIAIAFILTGCHKNPLVNNSEMVGSMREKFFLRGENFPIVECTDYYSGLKQSATLKKKCDQWTQVYYHRLINSHSIPVTTTLENFRDPVFWKQVKATRVR